MPIYKRAKKFIKSLFTRLINKSMDPIEKLIVPKKDLFLFPPIFIIGAPRSGSTLLYQTLINTYKFGYLTNLHSQFYGCPYLLQALFGRWIPETHSPYRSLHGKVEGLLSPSECGEFWYRWFRRHPQYVPIEDVDMQRLRSLRRVLIGLTDAFSLPMLFKNLLCALRLQPLSSLLPEARFIFIQRNPLWMAQSLLLGREQIYQKKSIWWSMEPPDIQNLLRLAPEEQVVRQVDSIHRLIQRESRLIGEKRFLKIQYENFCLDVHGTMEKIRIFLSQDKIKLIPRFQVPKTFPVSESIRLPQKEFDKLRVLVKEICSYD